MLSPPTGRLLLRLEPGDGVAVIDDALRLPDGVPPAAQGRIEQQGKAQEEARSDGRRGRPVPVFFHRAVTFLSLRLSRTGAWRSRRLSALYDEQYHSAQHKQAAGGVEDRGADAAGTGELRALGVDDGHGGSAQCGNGHRCFIHRLIDQHVSIGTLDVAVRSGGLHQSIGPGRKAANCDLGRCACRGNDGCGLFIIDPCDKAVRRPAPGQLSILSVFVLHNKLCTRKVVAAAVFFIETDMPAVNMGTVGSAVPFCGRSKVEFSRVRVRLQRIGIRVQLALIF